MAKFRSDLFAHLSDLGLGLVEPDRGSAAAPFKTAESEDGLDSLIATVRHSPSDAGLLREAAHRFDAAGQVAYAADCYTQMAELGELSLTDALSFARSLLSLGETAEALPIFLANVHVRSSGEILAIAGNLADVGLHREALKLLLRRSTRSLNDFSYLRLLAFLLGQRQYPKAALRVAEAALKIDPSDHSTQVFLASQLAAIGRHNDAASILLGLPELSASDNELAASVLLTLGRRQEALDHADAALRADPKSASYLALRAHISGAMHRIEAAAADILEARRLQPDSEAINRSAFIMATEAGHYDEALRIGAWLVSRYPDEEGISQTLKVVMERRDRKRLLDRIERTQPSEPVVTSPDRARERGSTDQVHPSSQQARIILALILRETKTRFGRARFGYLWVIFEPLAHIGIMITLISMFSHSKLPPIGTNFALFYFTGIIPYHLFTHTVGHMINSVPENKPLLQLPLVKVFDVFVARGVLELITELSVAAILLLGFVLFGLFTPPDNVAGIVLAMALIWITAFGLGLLSSVLNAYFSGWERIWGAVSSILYFSSGTFYIPRVMPEYLRDILAWNPILQAIELIRSSYFYTPLPFWLDVRYMIACAFGTLALGLVAQRLFRAKLLGTE